MNASVMLDRRVALDRHVALIGFMGAGKSTLGREVAERLGRRFLDLDREIERKAGHPVPQLFAWKGERVFRVLEARETVDVLRSQQPAVLALGGGAVASASIRDALRERAVTVLLEVDPEEAWCRVQETGGERPLATDRVRFLELYEERLPIYRESADATARDGDGVVLAAAGIHVGLGSLELLGELIPGDGPVALVADSRVAGIHGADAQLALGSRLASTHELPPGEQAKTVAACERLWSELKLERNGILVALGGGCTTDAAGFAAATYMRGLDWVAVPTTLVGQVDAAIGGKTALNLSEAKNLVGAFQWPLRTVVDPGLLETLPPEERSAGMAEVVKTGLLAGEPLWTLPEPELVRRCAAFKAALCLRDPRELGPRAVLNLGHTFAHALEAAGGYTALSHGHAVALGLRAALRLSVEHVGLDPSVAEEVERVLKPTPAVVDREAAWAALARDKKAAGGRPRLVLLEAPGRPVTGVALPDDEVRRALDALIAG
jgi:shikimate kinase / 3-dehydroquinate synthase